MSYETEEFLQETVRILRTLSDDMLLEKIREDVVRAIDAKNADELARIGNEMPDNSFIQMALFHAANHAENEDSIFTGEGCLRRTPQCDKESRDRVVERLRKAIAMIESIPDEN